MTNFTYICGTLPKTLVMKQFITLILLAVYTAAFATPKKEQYTLWHISHNDGLAQSAVTSFATDTVGTLWIGTRFGLFRQVNGKLVHYEDIFDNDGEARLGRQVAGKYIKSLFRDYKNSLWVFTLSGASLYNAKWDSFLAFPSLRTATTGCSLDSLNVFACEEGLKILSGKTNQLEAVDSSLAHVLVKMMLPVSNRSIVIVTENGDLLKYDVGESFRPFSTDSWPKMKIASACVCNGKVFAALYYCGIAVFDLDGHLLTLLDREKGLPCEAILDMKPYRGKVWIATDGAGIQCLDPETYAMMPAIDRPSMSWVKLNTSSFMSLFFDDKKDLMAAGTVKNGAYIVVKTPVKTYGEGNWEKTGEPAKTNICCIAPEGDGHTFWVGTDGGGLDRFDVLTGRFVRCANLDNTKVTAVADIGDGKLALTVFGKGLCTYDKVTGRIDPFHLETVEKERLEKLSGVSPRLSVAKGCVFIGGKTLSIFDLRSKTFKKFSCDAPDRMTAFRVLSDGEHIYGVSKTGVFEVGDDGAVTLLATSDSTWINSACYYAGRIWLGRNDGLWYVNVTTKEMMHIVTPQFGRVTCVVADERGRLWIGADNKLFCYDVASGAFHALGRDEGALHNELSCSANDLKSGYIVVGGSDGLVSLDKDYVFADNDPVRIRIRWADVDDKVWAKTFTRSSIILPYSYKYFCLHLAADRLDMFTPTSYCVRIDGDGGQKITTNDLDIQVGPLRPGNYNIYGSYRMKNGLMSGEQLLGTVKVRPPFFMRWWVIMLASLIVCCLVWLYVYRAKREMKVRYAVNEQRLKNEFAEKQIKTLTNIGYELRTDVMLALSSLRRLVEKKVPLQMENVKNVFGIMKKLAETLESSIDTNLAIQRQDCINVSDEEILPLVQGVVERFKSEYYREKLATLRLNVDAEVSKLKIPLDAKKIDVVISILLTNSLKMIPKGGQVIVSLNALSEDSVRISVSDDGNGFPQGVLENPFKPVDELSYYDKLRLGIIRVDAYVSMHGGKLQMYNNEKGGATVSFILSASLMKHAGLARDCKETVELTRVTDEMVVRHDVSSLTALVVDDDTDTLACLKEDLGTAFFNVLTAHDGNEALTILADDKYDVDIILTDLVMSPMDGFALLHAIKTSPDFFRIPVVMMSARCELSTIANAYKLGADNFIPKPASAADILVVMMNVLHNRAMSGSGTIRKGTNVALTDDEENRLLLERVNTYLEKNYGDVNLNRSSVAAALGVGETTFYNKFKAASGISFTDYCNKFRCRKVAEKLTKTNLSLAEIADDCGFSSPAYLSRVFLKFYMMSPGQFRKTTHDKRDAGQ